MEKQFVGRVKTIKTQYGDLVKISLSPEDLKKANEKGWLNLVMKKGKNGEGYLTIDTWTPDASKKVQNSVHNSEDGMPF